MRSYDLIKILHRTKTIIPAAERISGKWKLIVLSRFFFYEFFEYERETRYDNNEKINFNRAVFRAIILASWWKTNAINCHFFSLRRGEIMFKMEVVSRTKLLDFMVYLLYLILVQNATDYTNLFAKKIPPLCDALMEKCMEARERRVEFISISCAHLRIKKITRFRD